MTKRDFYRNTFYNISDEEAQCLYDIEQMVFWESYWVDITTNELQPYYVLGNQLAQCIAIEKSLSWIFNPNIYFPLFPHQIKNECNYKIKPAEDVKYKLHKGERDFVASFFSASVHNENPFKLISERNTRYTIYKLPFENILSLSWNFAFNYERFKLKKDDPDKLALLEILNRSLELLKTYVPKEKKKITSYTDHLSLIFLLHHLDKDLKLFKIVQMNHWKNVLTSNAALNYFCKSLDLNYEEILNLKQDIMNAFFQNKEFIGFCLTSKYPDPFRLLYHTIKSTIENYQNIKFEHEDRTTFEYWVTNNPNTICPYSQSAKRSESDFISTQLPNDFFNIDEFFSFCKKNVMDLIRRFDKRVKEHVGRSSYKEYSFNFEDEIEIKASKPGSKIDIEYSKKNVSWEIDFYLSFLRSEKAWNIVFFEEELENAKELFWKAESDSNKQKTYWNDYYFSNQKVLEDFLKSPDSEEYEYMNFLFSFVIENLSQFS